MDKKTKIQIDKVKEKILPILLKYGVTHIGLFGSIVHGMMTSKSDIDILVEFPKKLKISLLDVIHIRNEIKDVLGKEVDLIQYPAIKPLLRKKILSEEVKIL
ncbi:nucleotidyltransferase family protein [bacterium]|jgi:predicted nucleotidyltransferase|nr:nucleotidyltransferase family protein [bacterium]